MSLYHFHFSALSAKALHHKETLCKRDEVQRFLSSLVSKPPEVGHLVNCFHIAKTESSKAGVAKPVSMDGKKAADSSTRKVVTFSTIENF